MTEVSELCAVQPRTRYFGPAEVLDVDRAGGRVRVCLIDGDARGPTWARVATGQDHLWRPGDQALVAGEETEHLYVIGLLKAERKAQKRAKLDIGSGAYADLDRTSPSPRLRVFDKRHELLFSYDPESETARVNSSGHLEFVTDRGGISFRSSRAIRLEGQTIELKGRTAVRLAVEDTIGRILSAFSLTAIRAKLSSRETSLVTRRGQFSVEDARFSGKNVECNVSVFELVAETIETTAKTVFEKAKDIYRSVERLCELKAGRVRTLVSSSYFLKSRRASLKSQENFKVDAEEIHLG